MQHELVTNTEMLTTRFWRLRCGQVGANFWIFWISILIPVAYVIIGAVVGFVMGITYGSILAGLSWCCLLHLESEFSLLPAFSPLRPPLLLLLHSFCRLLVSSPAYLANPPTPPASYSV